MPARGGAAAFMIDLAWSDGRLSGWAALDADGHLVCTEPEGKVPDIMLALGPADTE